MKTRRHAFTLVELLVSMAIMTVLLLVLLAIVDQTSRTWRYTTGKVEQFRSAREAFEAVTRRLSQATLNTYWDYDNPKAPTKYIRQSDLRFISGNASSLLDSVRSVPKVSKPHPADAIFFQAPLGFVDKSEFNGLENLLNTWGYFIEFNSDSGFRPDFINKIQNWPERYRYRLMEFMEPSNRMWVYSFTTNLAYKKYEWFQRAFMINPPPPTPVHVLAENVIAVVFLPKLSPQDQQAGNYSNSSLAPSYFYSSTGEDNAGTKMPTLSDPNLNPTNQLPPVVQVVMVAIDEASANRLASGPTMPDFKMANLFTDATKLDADLLTLQTTLADMHLSSRVFTTNVSIRSAKWSRN